MFHGLRYGLRRIGKSPGFSLVSACILALGIGANSILFTFINAYILRPLPFANPERNVEIRARDSANRARAFWSYPEFRRLATEDGPLDAAYGYAHFEAPYREAGLTLKGVAVTGNLFTLMRARPALGRFFGPEEDSVPGRDAALVISESAWRRLFKADPSVVGRSIVINQRPFTIVGVAEAGFTGLDPIMPDCWAPLAMYERLNPESGRIEDPERLWIIAAGLLKPGVSLPHAARP